MSTERTWQTESTGLEATLKLAAEIGRRLGGGETIVLTGDLGAGKTAFVSGLAQGAGSDDRVHSPSFTLSNQYQAGDLTLHHFDFYRLTEPGIMGEELKEILHDPKAVVLIEWAGIVEDTLPARHLTIIMTATSETNRRLTFTYPDELQYLIPIKT